MIVPFSVGGGSRGHTRLSRLGWKLWRPDPTNESIQAWYRPDELMLNMGGDLASWNDQSGNAYHAIAGSTAPTVSTPTLNGFPVVDFTSAARLATASIPRLHGVNATIFLVYRLTIDHGPAFTAQWTPGDAAQRTATIHHNWTGDFYADIGNNGGSEANRLKETPTFVNKNAWEMVTIERSLTYGYVWHNSALEIIKTDMTSDVPTDSQPFKISLGFVGQIAEIIICNAVLSTATRQKVEGYLMHKYGLSGLLYANHPNLIDHPYESVAV